MWAASISGKPETPRRSPLKQPAPLSSTWRGNRSPMGREIWSVRVWTFAPSLTSRVDVSALRRDRALSVIAPEKTSLTYQDIVPVNLSSPDAAAAFVRGSIDARAIWDPYFAIGEKHGGQILVNRNFATRYPGALRDVIDTLAQTAVWAEANRDKVAKSLADVTGVDVEFRTIPGLQSAR
jgi:hypothetical protein